MCIQLKANNCVKFHVTRGVFEINVPNIGKTCMPETVNVPQGIKLTACTPSDSGVFFKLFIKGQSLGFHTSYCHMRIGVLVNSVYYHRSESQMNKCQIIDHSATSTLIFNIFRKMNMFWTLLKIVVCIFN